MSNSSSTSKTIVRWSDLVIGQILTTGVLLSMPASSCGLWATDLSAWLRQYLETTLQHLPLIAGVTVGSACVSTIYSRLALGDGSIAEANYKDQATAKKTP